MLDYEKGNEYMDEYLPTLYQQYIYLSRYSRWLWEKNRRETWPETVARYFDFFEDHLLENNKYKLPVKLRKELEDSILNLHTMPSMRCLMTAGEALKRENIAGYNCSYVTVDNPRSFDEILYILMNGTGVGFSVERQYINQLPAVAEEFFDTDTTIVVSDSKLGWAKAFKELIQLLYSGQVPRWDLSRIRPGGAALKTFGGRASGPEPLEDLFHFCVRMFTNAPGRKLTSLECHDIVCKVADVVVVGGVRRAALISLSNLSDDRMRMAKSGQWWEENMQRSLANNSAAYTEKPDIGIFMEEWLSLYNSKSGERGIFNRQAAVKQAGKAGKREVDHDFGVNPCGEIILRPRGFCNLSEVVVRPNDTEEILTQKVKVAAILGTFQSTLTDFRYISRKWQENAEEERLLGVSITGIMSNKLLYDTKSDLAGLQQRLLQHVIETNKEYAKKLGINQATATTCVKPSGTVSQLVNCPPGIHCDHSQYYIRTVRGDNKDPLTKFLQEIGVPNEPDVTKPHHTTVFSFPIETGNSTYKHDMSAIEQLELWLVYQQNWCEHNPSITVTVKENEWLDVGAWVYNNFDNACGLTFLPATDHIYRQAPYQECNKKTYTEMVKKMPTEIDWSELSKYENTDTTEGSQELACTSGQCLI